MCMRRAAIALDSPPFHCEVADVHPLYVQAPQRGGLIYIWCDVSPAAAGADKLGLGHSTRYLMMVMSLLIFSLGLAFPSLFFPHLVHFRHIFPFGIERHSANSLKFLVQKSK